MIKIISRKSDLAIIQAKLVGEAYKQESDVLDGQVLEGSKQKLLTAPNAENFHNYVNISVSIEAQSLIVKYISSLRC